MNNIMEYQGYQAEIVYSSEDNTFVGKVLDVQDLLMFHGDSVQELRQMFEEVITEYQDYTLAQTTKEPLELFNYTVREGVFPETEAEEEEKRANFVSNLGLLLKQARLGIDTVRLCVLPNGGEEVHIFFKNGARERVNVTYDSFVSIIRDVTKYL